MTTSRAAALALLLLLPGCSGSSDTPAVAPSPTAATTTDSGPTITIRNFAFSTGLSVAPGTTITVKNLDDTAHTVTSDDGKFDAGEVTDPKTFKAPATAGTYKFHCNIHSSMHGAFTVT